MAVLTVTNGLPEGAICTVRQVQDLLSHMTGNRIFLHQIPRAKDVCGKYLQDEHRWLEGLNPTTEQKLDTAKLRRWAAAAVKERGETLRVRVLPGDAYTYIDPIIENAMIVDAAKRKEAS